MAPASYRDLCLVCNRARKTCFCKYTKPFQTRTRFVILMHPKEFKRQRTGTGRVTNLSLIGSRIFVGEDFTQHTELNAMLADTALRPFLLFPGASAINLSAEPLPPGVDNQVPLVIILDATWQSARKMLRLSQNLGALPRITFGYEAASRFVIKRQPYLQALSTIEAVYHVLQNLERTGYERLENRHAALLETLNAIVDFQLRCAADPALPSHRLGKKSAERVVSAAPARAGL